jgi:hypothetical protein
VTLDAEQVAALAPDAASLKAGRALASERHWSGLGRSPRALWGLCQGSGSKPYQAQVDLEGPAFRCSCPSRKFPCKHSLGLFLILAGQPAKFTQAGPPDWVSSWLQARAERADRKAEKPAAETTSTPSDREPGEGPRVTTRPTKAAVERLAKVDAGMKELELWLGDLVRRGLASLSGESYAFWGSPAARMVDAQAPGMARLLR